ncbi:MAG TPA: alpha/beta hydrolase [Caulobacteraceae bacterium]|jgi:acetyl esterase/lipase|nr:alpha/beta hydrolase [Caulobacteraceae bacterium]
MGRLQRAVRLAGMAVVFAGTAAAAPLLDWPDLLARPMPQPTREFAYGAAALQVADLWLPAGKGPFPVVLMVHGGCWRSGVAKLTIMNYAAEDLRRRGIAVWNVEYRGVDRPGGGYPGTFQDVAAGADKLAAIAPAYHLRTGHVVAFGHSAGGHLALWLAARPRLPASSPLRSANPLPIAAVVSSGGLPDLEAVRSQDICGADNVAKLVGSPSPSRPDVYADTSPAELGAGRDVEQLISGEEDPLAPPALADAYAAKMKRQGARISALSVPDTGHVELISPGAAAWARTVTTIEALLRR